MSHKKKAQAAIDSFTLFGAIPNVLHREVAFYSQPSEVVNRCIEELAQREFTDKLPLAINMFELGSKCIQQAAFAIAEVQRILLPAAIGEIAVSSGVTDTDNLTVAYKAIESVLRDLTQAAGTMKDIAGTFFDGTRASGGIDFSDEMQEEFNAELRSKLNMPGGAQ